MSLKKEQIKNTPWVTEMLNTLQVSLTNTVISFAEIAMELSEKKEDIDSWVNVFQEQLQENMDDLLNDMKHLQSDTINDVENCLKKIQELCKILRIEMPSLSDESQRLYQARNSLHKYIQEYEKIIESKTLRLKELMVQQEKLCKSLGKEIKVFSEDSLPSQSEINNLQDYIEDLVSEHYQRLEKYTDYREDILKLVTSLKYKPTNRFEKEICNHSDDKDFCVSDEYMDQLDKFRHKLVSEELKLHEEINNLWNAISQHWNMLEVDLIERERFKTKYPGRSYEVLSGLNEELRRCQELKKANIKIFVERLRNELNEQWQKCRCTENIKWEFGFLKTNCYTEDLLELHENEFKKWKDYYEENKELILLLEKHEELWSKMIRLEENATSANRYNNRGGQLLKEEKQRNALSKHIPIIGEELKELAKKYEIRHGVPFLTFGQTVTQYINNLHEERENTRKLKLSAKKQQTIATPSVRSYISGMQQTTSTSKRRLALTPLMEDQKRAKLTSRLVATEPKKNTKIMPKVTVTRVSIERKKRTENVKRRSIERRSIEKQKNQQEKNELVILTEYSDFQNEITSRKDSRSTLNSISEHIGPPPDKPPVRTPLKVTVCTTPCTSNKPQTEGRTPRTPLTLNRTTTLSTATGALKLIF